MSFSSNRSVLAVVVGLVVVYVLLGASSPESAASVLESALVATTDAVVVSSSTHDIVAGDQNPSESSSSEASVERLRRHGEEHQINPHIVALPPSPFKGLQRAESVLNFMREECRAHIPLLQQASWQEKRGIHTKYNDQTYFFQSSLVCYNDNTKWFYDPTEQQQSLLGNDGVKFRPFEQSFNKNAIHLKRTAGLHAIPHNMSEFTASLDRAIDKKSFYFHRSLAMLSSGHWGTVSIYHFLMDLLLGMVSVVLSNPELEQIPRDTVQMHENHIVREEKWNLMPCSECLSVAPIVTDNLNQSNITISYKGPWDGSMRCFCGMVFVHHQGLTSRSECCSKPITTRNHVTDVMGFVRARLVEKWSFRPYGEHVQYSDYAKYGYWLNSTNPRAPRLLFLLRTKSRYIGKKEDMMDAARKLGFAVHSMAFETETMERQFAAGRYADVVVGTHGAALTTQIMMHTSDDVQCRSTIELFHWAPLGRIVHYQKMANMVNVSVMGLQPVDVLFGKTVANPRKERKLLKSYSYTWKGTGFHDQTSFYDIQAFRTRLLEAIQNLKRCRDVDVSAMTSE